MKKKLVSMMLVMGLVLTLCPMQASAKPKLNKSKATLYVGETVTLKMSGTKKKVTWKSNKKSVATVSKTGLVTAKKKGTAKITAKSSGKKYVCKVKVSKLPKTYATVNGKKVKVGKTATLTYKIQSRIKISNIMLRSSYDKKGLQILTPDEKRFTTWLCNSYIPDYEDEGKVFDLYELVSIKPNTTEFIYQDVNCKKAKVFDKFKVKVLKSGNYTINTEITCCPSTSGRLKTKDYTVQTTVK